ncbi:MAG: hypothetical protein V2I33_12725 [Kangiellaceae bacterium]|nr:hypothetical protein [Kangiellaceae bacterium]
MSSFLDRGTFKTISTLEPDNISSICIAIDREQAECFSDIVMNRSFINGVSLIETPMLRPKNTTKGLTDSEIAELESRYSKLSKFSIEVAITTREETYNMKLGFPQSSSKTVTILLNGSRYETSRMIPFYQSLLVKKGYIVSRN